MMKLENAVKILARRYQFLQKRLEEVNKGKIPGSSYDAAEASALRTIVAYAVLNDEIGIVPDAVERANADRLLAGHLYLYSHSDRAQKKRLMKKLEATPDAGIGK